MAKVDVTTNDTYTEYRRLDELLKLGHPGNPKDHDIGAIRKSILRFGFTVPPTLDETTGMLVAGHGRLEALEELRLEWIEMQGELPKKIRQDRDGMWLVPLQRGVAFDSDAERDAYLLADNRLTEMGGWNEKLPAMLESIAKRDRELLKVTGFDEGQISKLLNGSTSYGGKRAPEGDGEHRGEALQAQWQVKTGDLWRIPSLNGGDHYVLCEDCTEVPALMRLFPGDERAQITFTSPPFNMGATAQLSYRDAESEGQSRYPGKQADQREAEAYLTLLKDFTTLALGVSDYVLVDVQMLADNKVALIEYLHEFRQRFADIAMWHKSPVSPAMADKVMNSSFDMVLILSAQQNPTRAIKTANWQRGLMWSVYSGSTNVGSGDHDIHRAAFPLKFASWGVENFSQHGATVYDPFGGTGTTLLACEQSGRLCRMMEIEPVYVALTLDRAAQMGLKPELVEVE